MITVDDIKKAVADTDFYYYGIRVDSGIKYNVGDTASNSRQLFQDPDFDENGELVYPLIEEGQNAGLYDAGELDGTSTIGFYADSDSSIEKALSIISSYAGCYIHILGGDSAEEGNDRNEMIIRRAEVLVVYEK